MIGIRYDNIEYEVGTSAIGVGASMKVGKNLHNYVNVQLSLNEYRFASSELRLVVWE